MTTNDMMALALAGTAGLLLGAFFFGGLWWTVRKTVSSKTPALWMFVSLMLRMGVALTGIYMVSGRSWQRMLLCLLGFTIARPLVIRWTRTEEAQRAP